MSEAERGSTGDDSGRITPTPYNRRSSIERSSSTSGDWTSPIHGRRLPFTGGAEGRRRPPGAAGGVYGAAEEEAADGVAEVADAPDGADDRRAPRGRRERGGDGEEG